jgi:hypothetical protein
MPVKLTVHLPAHKHQLSAIDEKKCVHFDRGFFVILDRKYVTQEQFTYTLSSGLVSEVSGATAQLGVCLVPRGRV